MAVLPCASQKAVVADKVSKSAFQWAQRFEVKPGGRNIRFRARVWGRCRWAVRDAASDKGLRRFAVVRRGTPQPPETQHPNREPKLGVNEADAKETGRVGVIREGRIGFGVALRHCRRKRPSD
ncbi:hypothetical protein ERJ75_001531900 [Trypanosoma vivax]|nr:hypothetical protein ERJ75_001531900 [Trypanosoma vivax]